MERKKVLFAVNLFLLAFLGIFGLFLQAKEAQKIMSVEVKIEKELKKSCFLYWRALQKAIKSDPGM